MVQNAIAFAGLESRPYPRFKKREVLSINFEHDLLLAANRPGFPLDV